MQTGILKKIDLLVEMAESSASVETLKAEKKEVEIEINELKEELVSLRDDRADEKYFKISEKQVDENIKVSLEAKIRKQEKEIKKLQKEIDAESDEESSFHNQILKLKEEINLSNAYIEELEKRIETINDSSTKEYYSNVLKDENEKIKSLQTSLEDLDKKDHETLDRLNYLSQAMEEMNAKLEDEKERLAETKANLGNPASYLDEELKEQDDKRMEELQKQIGDLEKRRLEIITDPVMIANEAKEYIINNERSNALSKVQELVTIVKSKPYMDIPSSNELTAMLQEEEEAATNARDEFASLIDTKNYSSGDTEVIEERINFLKDEISSLEEKIKKVKEEIAEIDNTKFQDLALHLTNTINTYNQLQDELGEYKIIIETENEDKTPKRRAILAAAYEKKQKELEDVAKIIEHYKENQKVLVNKAYLLDNDNIKKYESEIAIYQQEIREMEYLLDNASKAKDVLAIENDKQKLKDLDAAVKNIKHRQKYSQTPSEIYDEIEISLGTMDVNRAVFNEESINQESRIFEEIIPEEENNIEMPLEEEVFEELPTEEESVMEETPVIEEITEDNPFIIGEYDVTSEEETDTENPEENEE